MVAYLLKPEGSKDFQQIVDFLNTSHIKFALTENPTIYTSLIQQFWQTASTSTLEEGEVEITATIDGQLRLITLKHLLEGHLKLVDGCRKLGARFKANQEDEETSWIQEDDGIQGRTSTDTEILLDQEEPTELVGDLGSGEKVYIRRNAEKRKDKGKAIMKEDESLQEEFDRARQEQEVVVEADQAHDIDWSDPAVLRYHAVQNRSFSKAEVRKNMCIYLKNQGGYKQSHFKGMKYKDIRPIFKRVWDQNQSFIPKDSDIEKEVMKRPGFDFQQKSSKKRSREDFDEDNAKK
ncbi:hypothetical protein Tco_1569989 [Tanacetum coccineum]